jgi:hypothetical protein
VSSQPPRRVPVEEPSSFRVRFTAVDVRHRGTVDDHVRIVFGENVVERAVLTEVELRERDVERRSHRVIGSRDIPPVLLTCTYDVTTEETVCTDDQESHAVRFR